MNQPSNSQSNLDPNLREKLLKETRNPLFGPRRVLWFVLFGSASVGLLIMLSRALTGDIVPFSDLSVQLAAFFIFGSLIWFDRKKDSD